MPAGSAQAASAPPPLTSADRRRLAGVLGLLSSSHDGEREAAAEAALRFLEARGLTWADVLGAENTRLAEPEDDLSFCRRHAAHLNEWQAIFTLSLVQRRKAMTAGQRGKLAQTTAELRAKGLS